MIYPDLPSKEKARNPKYLSLIPFMRCALLLAIVALVRTSFGQFNYATNNGALTITRYTGSAATVIIPESTNGMPITSIGTFAFGNATTPWNIKSVTVASTITNIDQSAFRGCSGLTNVFIPDSVKSIGLSAFDGCGALVSVTLPAGLRSLSYRLFTGCYRLNTVTIPAGVTNIGSFTFNSCSALSSVTLPDSVLRVESSAFANCTTLTNVLIGTNLASLGQNAFASCPALRDFSLPSTVTNIEPQVFSFCSSMSNILVESQNATYTTLDGVLFNKAKTTLVEYPAGKAGAYQVPVGVTTIGYGAFYGCPGVTAITVSDTVRTIGVYGFEASDNLLTVALGRGVTTINPYAFTSCRSMDSITVDPANVTFSSVDGVLFNKAGTIILAYPSGRSGAYAIPDAVLSVGQGAFNGCTGLTSVMISDNVRTIKSAAFSDCFGLTNVVIGSGLQNMEDFAFWSCTHLQSICFGGNAPTLGNSVFNSDPATVYYLPGTLGWGAVYGGLPTAPWTMSVPVILQSAGVSPRVSTNGFEFNISWGTNSSAVVVEVCSNLTTGVWTPLGTNDLSGWLKFVDPFSTNYPARFYRVRPE